MISQGEKMIYAVAFVRALEDGRGYAEEHIGYDVPNREAIKAQRRKSLLHSAHERAFDAVVGAREGIAGLREGYGDEISDMAEAMLEWKSKETES